MLTFTEYQRIEAVNWSALKVLIDGSPMHYRWMKDHPGENDTASRVFLRAIHCAILEPQRFEVLYGVFDGVKRGSKWALTKQAEPEKEFLKPDEMATIKAIQTSVFSHNIVKTLVSAGTNEISLKWVNPITQLLCKARLDILIHYPEKNLVEIWDLKTVGASASPDAVRRLAQKNYWIGQLDHYREAIQVLRPGKKVRCGIIALEDRAPFDLAAYYITEKDLNEAREERQDLLNILKICQESNLWPGRCAEIEELEMKPWEEPKLIFEKGE